MPRMLVMQPGIRPRMSAAMARPEVCWLIAGAGVTGGGGAMPAPAVAIGGGGGGGAPPAGAAPGMVIAAPQPGQRVARPANSSATWYDFPHEPHVIRIMR